MSDEVKVEETVVKRGRPRKYPYPAQLVCSVTGKVVKTNPTQFKTQLDKSGKDMETFIKTYVCRSARKEAKIKESTKVEPPTNTVVN